MRIKCTLVILFFCFQIMPLCANLMDSLGYVLPVKHDIRLSGNYMELRKNHFHSGIDIKSSKGKVGDPVFSIHDGYISRIKIQSGGYGQAVYINHPTGHTSVYAHLDAFNDKIAAYIKEVQYTLESFEVDLYLPDSLLMIEREERIGNMGNTGRSFGPHLHFELRETYSELPLNPEVYGFGPSDNRAPVINKLIVYGLDSLQQVLARNAIAVSSEGAHNYHIHDAINTEYQIVGFGLHVYDQMDGSYNKNGIYKYELYANDNKLIEWKADTFSFSESRLINGFLDYSWLQLHNEKIYKLFTPDCNRIIQLSNIQHNGLIKLEGNKTTRIKIKVLDLYNNEATLSFEVKQEKDTKNSVDNLSDCSEGFLRHQGPFEIDIDPEQFFTPVGLKLAPIQMVIDNQTCKGIRIGNANDPIRGYYRISSKHAMNDKRWCLISQDSKQRWVNFGGKIIGDSLVAEVDMLGEFYVYHDTVGPFVEPISFQTKAGGAWRIKIYDNLIPDGKLPDLYYRATINEKWIRMQYDLKNDMLVFTDFEQIPKGQSKFELVVADHQGNSTRITRNIQK